MRPSRSAATSTTSTPASAAGPSHSATSAARASRPRWPPARPGTRFVTVLHGRFTVAPGRLDLELAGGGHPRPLLLHADGTVEPVDTGGTIVGMLEAARFRTTRVTLTAGETLLMYTDGVTEARRRGEQLGAARLAGILADSTALPAQAITERVEQQVRNWIGESGAADDLALLALQPEPGPRLEVVRWIPAASRHAYWDALAAGDARAAVAREHAATSVSEEVVLALAGWQVQYLGASVPTAHLVQHLHDVGPDVTALSCSVSTSLPRARRMIEGSRQAGVPVICGGLGRGAAGVPVLALEIFDELLPGMPRALDTLTAGREALAAHVGSVPAAD